MHHLRLAVRALFKTPLVTLVAVISLALGIGANGAIFSLFDQMILRGLPVPDSDRLVNLSAPGPRSGSENCGIAGPCEDVFSYPMFRDLERHPRGLSALAAHASLGVNLAFEDRAVRRHGRLVSGGYFSALGLVPALGRLIDPEDDKVPGQSAVVVLGHHYWHDQLGGRMDIIGRKLIVNAEPMTVIGVAPATFQGNVLGIRPDVYVPLTMVNTLSPRTDDLRDRRSYWLYVFGRLAPGVSLAEAGAALQQQYSATLQEVEAPLQEGMSAEALEQFVSKPLLVSDGSRGQSRIHHMVEVPLLLLFSVAGVVLLIACANVANLALARSAGRASDIAVRLSMGASRGSLIRLLLTESCLLATLGGLAGLLFARWTLVLIGQVLPAAALQGIALELSVPAMLFSLTLALGTGILFGLFPALHGTKVDVATNLKRQTAQTSGGRTATRFRAVLVTAQIAMSTTLLVCAGLFLKSLVNVNRVDLGLDIENLATFSITPVHNGYSSEQARALFIRAEEALAALPGVTRVTAARVPVLAGSDSSQSVTVEGYAQEPGTDDSVHYNEIGPGYFETLGIPLLAGRALEAGDSGQAPRVAIVNRAFAKRFGLASPVNEASVIGMRMATGSGARDLDIEIVGLIPDAKYSVVKGATPPVFYLPYRQAATAAAITFYLRTVGPAEDVLAAAASAMRRLDPNLPLEHPKTMSQQVRDSIFVDTALTKLSAAFAGLATLLAAVVLYGVLAYTVSQRTREIGLRMAFGANRGAVQRLVLRKMAVMALVGGGIGMATAVAFGTLARSQLFELEGHDPTVLIASTTLIAFVALSSAWLPAHKASRIEVMEALRHE